MFFLILFGRPCFHGNGVNLRHEFGNGIVHFAMPFEQRESGKLGTHHDEFQFGTLATSPRNIHAFHKGGFQRGFDLIEVLSTSKKCKKKRVTQNPNAIAR